MRIAFLADIHANLHALHAVLRDIAEADMDQLVFLGDVVGYGAHPAECVELLQRLDCRGVMGNHDFYTISDAPGIEAIIRDPNSVANPVWAAIHHARRELDSTQLDWLRALEPVGSVEDALVAHAALHDFDEWPYLRSQAEAEPTLALLDGRLGFFGHTHRENLFAPPDGPRPELIAEHRFHLPSGASLAVTAGSTGQPRDGDARARWLSWDSSSRILEFHRVPYDHEAAAQAILEAGLPPQSAARLLPVTLE